MLIHTEKYRGFEFPPISALIIFNFSVCLIIALSKESVMKIQGFVHLFFVTSFFSNLACKGELPIQPMSTPLLFLVTRVIDGDTIEIEGGQKVRYIGIDTPETVDPRKPVQCFGVQASNKNKELVIF